MERPQQHGLTNSILTEYREIQEEDQYICFLQAQRKRIEGFISDSRKKDERLAALSKQLQAVSAEKELADSECQQLRAELNMKTDEVATLQDTMRVQLEDYQAALHQLQLDLLAEQESRNTEFRALKQRLQESNSSAEEDSRTFKEHIVALEAALKDTETAHAQEIHDLTTQWQAYEQTLKTQILALSNEVSQLNTFSSRQRRQGSPTLRDSPEESASRLREELQQAMTLVKKQETLIVELKAQKQEDDACIAALNSEVRLQQERLRDLDQVRDTSSKEVHEHYARAIKHETQNKRLEADNLRLQQELEAGRQRDAAEKEERRRFAQLKMEMLDQRTAEVNRLSNALDSFASRLAKC